MIPFAPPRIDQEMIDEVVDTLRSGWITTGPKTRLFEQQLATYCEVEDVLAVNSATAGLELMLRWFGVGPGDEVIVPAYTYCATANVVIHCGAKPVMVDVGPDFNINVEGIAKALSAKTKVILPVDLGGWPCDYDEILQIARNAPFKPANEIQEQLGRILVLTDGAHSLGARYKERISGSLADATVFSFHAVKNLTTAEGGAIALNLPSPFDNGAIYTSLRTKSLHGQSNDALAKFQKSSWEYDVFEAGYKMNLTDIQAALGIAGFKVYESETLPRRRAIFEEYNKALAEFPWATIPPLASNSKKSACHLYLLKLKNIDLETRNLIIQKILAKKVAVNVHYKPLPILSFYKKLGYDIADFPVANEHWCTEITLPVFYGLSNSNIEEVVSTLSSSVHSDKNETIV